MKRLIVVLSALFAFGGSAFAAVDINKATAAELEALKGLGKAKAQAIVDFRTKNGPFKSVEDLDRVKGIGSGIIAKIAPEITIDGKPVNVSALKATDSKKPGKEAMTKNADDKTAAAPAGAKPADKKEVKAQAKKN
jgi:competence protein ComEA